MSEAVKRHPGPVGMTTTSECTCVLEGRNEITCSGEAASRKPDSQG